MLQGGVVIFNQVNTQHPVRTKPLQLKLRE